MTQLLNDAYQLLVRDWGVDGDHDLLSVADALLANDRTAAVRALEQQIEFKRAELRAYIALRSALATQDAGALAALKNTDPSDIAQWPDRSEA